jgi:two-component system chemotaxis response regulator CheY
MRALVIDDSRAMRSILRGPLDHRGFVVDEAEHGQEAIEHLTTGDVLPDVCLVDWNMPVMNGLEFVTAVRRTREWRQITLMMVTTESEHSQVVRALAAGAHEYVIKPFTGDAIVDKLNLLGLVDA